MLTPEELEESNQYQDYIQDLLHNIGITIGIYTSYKYQIEKGESRAGFEIKYDKQLASTGNIYIEVKERHNSTDQYIDSGIARNDNTLFYIIGNYDRVFMFSKRQLAELVRTGKFKLVENKYKTSIGYVIPVERKRPEQEWVLDEHKNWLLAEWKGGRLYEKEKHETCEIGTR